MAKRLSVLNRRRRRRSKEFHYCEFDYKPVASYEADPHFSLTKKQCSREGMACYLPRWEGESPPEYYCWEHREVLGYCIACGQFGAGLESFDFGKYRGYCENCSDELELEDSRWESDYDVDYYGEGYDFDEAYP